MSLNFSLIDTLKLFKDLISYPFFLTTILFSLLIIILLILNSNRKISKYILISTNITLVILILFYYIKKIIGFKFYNPIGNIYVYFINSIIYLVISSLIILKRKYNIIDYILYFISTVFILFSIFMTHYLKVNYLVIIGNIYPIIVFGNILYFLYYIILIIKNLLKKCGILTKNM